MDQYQVNDSLQYFPGSVTRFRKGKSKCYFLWVVCCNNFNFCNPLKRCAVPMRIFIFLNFFKRFLLLKKKRENPPLGHRGPVVGALPQDLYKQGNMLLNMHVKVQYRLNCDGLNHKQ